jgi:PST family polysaccharide transporter
MGAGLAANGFNQPGLVPILRGLSPLFLITSLSGVQRSILERKLAFQAVAVRTLISTLTGGLVDIAMAMLGFGIWSLIG